MDLIVDNGKPVEPSAGKKIISSLIGDNKMTMVFSHNDIQQMIIDKIFHDTHWMPLPEPPKSSDTSDAL